MKRGCIALLAVVLLIRWALPSAAFADATPQVDATGNLPCCPSPRFLGPRSKDGIGREAGFDRPVSITYDADDRAFFIADAGSNTIRRLDPNGRVSTVAGACDRELLQATCVGRELDGDGTIARFDIPIAIAYDAKRHGLVVYDGGSSRVRFVTTNGLVGTRGFVSDIRALAVDSRSGRWFAAQRNALVVLDDNDLDSIRAINVWTAPKREGVNPGAPAGEINSIAVDSETGLVYAMLFGNAVMRIDPARAGAATVLAGDPDSKESVFSGLGRDGSGSNASFQVGGDIAFDSLRRRVIVADVSVIRSISLDGVVRTIAGGCEPQSNPRYRGEFACDYPAHDGVGNHAHFGWPIRDVAVDTQDDTIAVLDGAFVKMIAGDGGVTTVAGNARPVPSTSASRWNGGYLDTNTGERMSVYVDGDHEIEIFQDAGGRVFDVKQGSRNAALANEQFWTSPSYVRTGPATAAGSYAAALSALNCGPFLPSESKNPISQYALRDPHEMLFTSWYHEFGTRQTASYSRSPACVVVRVTDGAGHIVYEDAESRVVPHALPAGLLEYPDERRPASESSP